MNICICTTPIRPAPTTFPPFGSMDIIVSLRKIGEQVSFFNIDYFRYRHDQIEAYFGEKQFDIVGISAVVSTAYSYTKYLAELIRRVSPRALIIVGGNLAASAEILLRKCQVDFCVIGDGEIIIQDLVKVLYENPLNYAVLKATKGIAFLDENEEFYFTGYGVKPSAEESEFPDYKILDADGSLPYFITEVVSADQAVLIKGYDRPVEPGETMATVVMAKGCVARCTFCHRWERGFHARPADKVIEHVKFLMDTYNVRFVNVSDENFGADRKLTDEIATRLGELGVTWMVAGVRARTVKPEALKHWKANGCLHAYFGIESGSQTILDVMEKNTTVEENLNALKWTYEAGLGTIIQLVIGMPGETDKTIAETIEFLKQASDYQRYYKDNDELPSTWTSINYAQALPGTPLYEYARQRGFIGKSVDEEEKYLERISDTDAYKTDHFVNYTGQPMLKVQIWMHWILAELDTYHLRRTKNATMSLTQVVWYYTRLVSLHIERRLKMKSRLAALFGGSRGEAAENVEHKPDDHDTDSGYFNIRKTIKFSPLLLNPITRPFFYPIMAVVVAFGKAKSPVHFIWLLAEHIFWNGMRWFRPPPELPKRSLRKIIKIEPDETLSGQDMMIPLRKGR